MTDRFGREIRYMRLSVTDRCNLRCRYCMPAGAAPSPREEPLRYEELLRVCGQAVLLGIRRFKVTGGEPLVRRGCAGFIRALRALPGVEQVTLTTNGLLLLPLLDELLEAGLDGVNVSVDTLDPALYEKITGHDGAAAVETLRRSLDACMARCVRTKVNVVLLEWNRDSWLELAALAARGVDVRFIELMPVGQGQAVPGVSAREALSRLRRRWPDLHPVDERRGNGPARYFASDALQGRLGVIDAVSRGFCACCNRVRLTSAGFLKPCLCYDAGADLRPLLRGGGDGAALRSVMYETIWDKPRAHCFDRVQAVTERRSMSQIGG